MVDDDVCPQIKMRVSKLTPEMIIFILYNDLY